MPFAWEPISATLRQITTQMCMPALAATWYTLTSVLLYQAIHICHCPLISLHANSVQHIPHIHNIQAINCLQLETDRCCHCVPCPEEPDHCTAVFITSHSEKNYHFQMILSLLPCLTCILYITNNLGRTFKYIGSLPQCIYISSSTCH
jgi:hypothetical protein